MEDVDVAEARGGGVFGFLQFTQEGSYLAGARMDHGSCSLSLLLSSKFGE